MSVLATCLSRHPLNLLHSSSQVWQRASQQEEVPCVRIHRLWLEALLSWEPFAWLSCGQAARLAKGEVDVLVCGKSQYFIQH